MLLASQTPSLFRRMLPADAPHYPMHVGFTEFLYLLAVTLLAGCIISWAPAGESLRVDLNGILRSGSSGAAKRSRIQSAIIAGQVALSLGLTVAAGCFLRFQYDVTVSDPGFDTRQVLVVPLTLRTPRDDAASAASFRKDVERRIRELPDVRTVASGAVPFGGSASEQVFPYGDDGAAGVDVEVDRVSVDYFDALQLGMMRGRPFQPGDLGGDVPLADIVVSKAFVDTYWKGQDPLEKTIRTPAHDVLRVIGVARDTKARQYGAVDPPRIYRLDARDPSGGPLLVRFSGKPQRVADAIRALIVQMDPQQHVIPRTVRSEMEDLANRLWLMTGLVVVLAGIAVFLAMTGLYAIVAFSVQQRTKELGVRAALGATHGRILCSVLTWGAGPVFTGAAIGLGIAVAGLFALQATLAGIPEAGAIHVRPLDPIVCILALSALTIVALTAIVEPARRALRLSPSQCLRQD
jgi:putative ABC transport system permease protein